MKREFLFLFFATALAACGDQPAPKPAPAPAPAAAVAPAAPAAAPAPVAAAVVQEAEKPDPDKELAKRVKHALEDEAKVQAAAIDVTASGGTVTLWGTAATTDERTRAGRIAYRVQGVTNVNNKLAVVKGS